MTSNNERRVFDVLDAILDLPADDRDAAAVRRCGDDARLLKRVRRLLAVDRQPGVLDRSVGSLFSRLHRRAAADVQADGESSRLLDESADGIDGVDGVDGETLA